MPSQVNLKALGLNYSPNNIDLPSGSLVKAENVIIRRDNVIESRRGFKLYGSAFGSIQQRANQLRAYRDRIILHYDNTLAFDDGSGNFTDFSGSYEETSPGLRIKFVASNGNLYFTTSAGIKKISAKTATDLTANAGYITDAGGIKALDVAARLGVILGDQTSWFQQDSVVAYRVVWASRDLNNNLILGTPSEQTILYNPMLQLIARDFNNLLLRLDQLDQFGSMITDGNYQAIYNLTDSSDANDLYTNLLGLTAKLDNDILYADNDGAISAAIPLELAATPAVISGTTCTVSFATGGNDGGNVKQYFDIGQVIYLSGFTAGTSGTLNGLRTITAIDPTANTLSFTTDATGTVTASSSATVTSGTFRNITVPSAPSTPTTHTQLQDLQTYLESIITALQNVTRESLLANDAGGTGLLNIDSASCSGDGSTYTVTFSVGDPRDYVQIGQQIYLSGFISASIDGYKTITNVTSTTLQFASTYSGSGPPDADAFISKTIVFNDELGQEFVDDLAITTTVTSYLEITIPESATTNNFYQVYRSAQVTAVGTDVLDDLVPSDELQLVFEGFPTDTELADGTLTVQDITPDIFLGANLYTNETTGEGIVQANDVPPEAGDVSLYKTSVFYANTQTRQRRQFKLLGVQDLIDEYNAGRPPKITIATSSDFHTYEFVTGREEETSLVCAAGSTALLASSYFNINSGNNENLYYFWFRVDNAGTDPALSGRTGLAIDVLSSDTSSQVAEKVKNCINTLLYDFNAEISSISTSTVLITTLEDGYVDDVVSTLPAGFTFTVTQQGRGEKVTQEVSVVTCVAGSAYAAAGTADYFSVFTPFGKQQYYVWFDRGSATDPNVFGLSGISIDTTGSETADQMAIKIQTALTDTGYFNVSVNTNQLTITSVDYGPTSPTTENVTSGGFTVSTSQEGELQVLLSTITSVGQAVENTAKSFVRVMNKNKGEVTYGYYLPGIDTNPGIMLLEGRDLPVPEFYILANNSTVAESFDPIVAPSVQISNIAAPELQATVTTSTPHGLNNLDKVLITNTDSTPSIDGIRVVTVINSTSFTVPVSTTANGTMGALIPLPSAEVSENEARPNRIFYSKPGQPEAVPLVNYFDVGPLENQILRIFPLRNSLFIFTEDGLYRVSGETGQYILEPFDLSCILIAPDSVDSSNNTIYAWTKKGIVTVTEASVDTRSRAIDTQILKLASSSYTNFATATWGIGYESDDSYLVWTVSNTNDTTATQCFRYSTLTQTWTTYEKQNTCGIVNPVDDRLVIGAGDVNQIEQERKDFTRTDYADRQYSLLLSSSGYPAPNTLEFSSVSDIEVGDVIEQSQTLSVFRFNSLLEKLDIDPSVPSDDYYSTLFAVSGDDMRSKMAALATKLDSEITESPTFSSLIASKTGTITGISVANPTVVTDSAHGLVSGRVITIASTDSFPVINGSREVTVLTANTFTVPVDVTTPGTTGTWSTQVESFQDIMACYNAMIDAMNTSTNFTFTNYSQIEYDTSFEAVVTAVNRNIKKVTLNVSPQFIVGEMTVFKSIPCSVTYAPETMGDPLGWKHLMEATIMFANRAFTKGKMGFSSDLIPLTTYVEFNSSGNGIFGTGTGPFGEGYFGGASNSSPFRTYVPRNYMRCRYINLSFLHSVAREEWSVYGVTISGNVGISTRAYRN